MIIASLGSFAFNSSYTFLSNSSPIFVFSFSMFICPFILFEDIFYSLKKYTSYNIQTYFFQFFANFFIFPQKKLTHIHTSTFTYNIHFIFTFYSSHSFPRAPAFTPSKYNHFFHLEIHSSILGYN